MNDINDNDKIITEDYTEEVTDSPEINPETVDINEFLKQEDPINDTMELIVDALHNENYDSIKEIAENLPAIDFALIVEEMPEDDDVLVLLELLEDTKLSEILEQASEELQQRIIQLLDEPHIIRLFSNMSKDDIVDILGNLSINKRKHLIRLMKTGEQKIIEELLGYAEDTAGGIMTTEYIALKSQLTVVDALKKIKEIGPRTEVIEVIFVLGEGRKLIGTADLRDILIAADDTTLGAIMNDNIVSVEPETDQESVSLLVSKYDLKAIPVVNKHNALLGIITVDDIIDVIVEEHSEDMLHLGGVSAEERIDSPIFASIKKRLPWLLINLVTAFLASAVVSAFEDTIAQVVALAAAMPIIAGMGGNSGSQTLAIVIRSIALGEADLKSSWKLVFRQIAVALIDGAVIGVIAGAILYLKYGNIYLGMIILAAMVGNMIISGIFGYLVPLILKVLKVDPALASSIFLTTATDTGGFFLFLGLAALFQPLLI